MLKLLYAPTTAGVKALLALEELQVPYSSLPINVFKKVQLTDTYKSIIPTAKIPSLIDDGKIFFESGAILYHLATKYNKLLPQNNREEALSWFFWDVNELTPKFLQYYRARVQNPDNKDMHDKIIANIKTLLAVLNENLVNKNYIAGEFSIADITVYSWLDHFANKNDAIPNLIDDLPHIKKWISNMGNREATKKISKLSEEFDWEAVVSEEEIKEFITN
ncbi:MAG: glutathione S-transferase family protein [Alphaproteobacteria bacterium]|nr:glutathione S-transferase family protein [Alphaproteobacteria bacterium]